MMTSLKVVDTTVIAVLRSRYEGIKKITWLFCASGLQSFYCFLFFEYLFFSFRLHFIGLFSGFCDISSYAE